MIIRRKVEGVEEIILIVCDGTLLVVVVRCVHMQGYKCCTHDFVVLCNWKSVNIQGFFPLLQLQSSINILENIEWVAYMVLECSLKLFLTKEDLAYLMSHKTKRLLQAFRVMVFTDYFLQLYRTTYNNMFDIILRYCLNNVII